MRPTEIDPLDRVVLGPCRLVTYAKDQPQYLPLPAAVLEHDERKPVVTRWKLTDEERQRLANGEDVYLMLLTYGHPLQPIVLTVGCPEICPMHKAG